MQIKYNNINAILMIKKPVI